MVDLLENASEALKRIIENLDENSELYENTKCLKYIIDSPLFVNLYNLQYSLNKVKQQQQQQKQLQQNENDDENSVDLIKFDDRSIKRPTTTTTTITTSVDESILLIKEKLFETIILKRDSKEQNYGFTVILIQHPQLNQTFVFIQDVETPSIAHDANLEAIDQILAVNGVYFDKINFTNAFQILTNSCSNIIELLIAKNPYTTTIPSILINYKTTNNNNNNNKQEDEQNHQQEQQQQILLNNNSNNVSLRSSLIIDDLDIENQPTTTTTTATTTSNIIENNYNNIDLNLNNSHNQMTFRDMVLNTEWTQVETIELENDPVNGFGFGITGNKSTGVIIKSITPGTVSHKDGRLHIGDHIFQIGDINVRSMSSEQVACVIRQIQQHPQQQKLIKIIVARPIRDIAQIDDQPTTKTDQQTPTETTTTTTTTETTATQILTATRSNIIETSKLCDAKSHDLQRLLNSQQQKLLGKQISTKSQEETLEQQHHEMTQDKKTENEIYSDDNVIINVEVNKQQEDCSGKCYGLNIDYDNNYKFYYISSFDNNSFLLNTSDNINVYDRIDEINDIKLNNYEISNDNFIRELIDNLNKESKLKLKLTRNCKYTRSRLIEKWKNYLNDTNKEMIATTNNYEIIVGYIDKTKQTTGLGISLEGTVDVENGQETRPHHYIRSILKEGPIDKCGLFKNGDELLEINNSMLYAISYIDLLNILKTLPNKIMCLTCLRKINDTTITINEQLTCNVDNNTSENVQNLHPLSSPSIQLQSGQSTSSPSPPISTMKITNNEKSPFFLNKRTENKNVSKTSAGRTPPIRSRSLELNGLAMWNTKVNYIDLIKGDSGLGFSIIDYQDPFNTLHSVIVIRSLVPNGAAQLDGRLLPGYRLVSVNSINLENATLEYAVNCLKQASKGVVRLGIQKPLPYPGSMSTEESKQKSTSSAVLIKSTTTTTKPSKFSLSSNNKNKRKNDDYDDEDDDTFYGNDKLSETAKLLGDDTTKRIGMINENRQPPSQQHLKQQQQQQCEEEINLIMSQEDEDWTDYGTVATSAPAILNHDFEVHYSYTKRVTTAATSTTSTSTTSNNNNNAHGNTIITLKNSFKPKLANVDENKIKKKTKIFKNYNENYDDDDDEDDDDDDVDDDNDDDIDDDNNDEITSMSTRSTQTRNSSNSISTNSCLNSTSSINSSNFSSNNNNNNNENTSMNNINNNNNNNNNSTINTRRSINRSSTNSSNTSLIIKIDDQEHEQSLREEFNNNNNNNNINDKSNNNSNQSIIMTPSPSSLPLAQERDLQITTTTTIIENNEIMNYLSSFNNKNNDTNNSEQQQLQQQQQQQQQYCSFNQNNDILRSNEDKIEKTLFTTTTINYNNNHNKDNNNENIILLYDSIDSNNKQKLIRTQQQQLFEQEDEIMNKKVEIQRSTISTTTAATTTSTTTPPANDESLCYSIEYERVNTNDIQQQLNKENMFDGGFYFTNDNNNHQTNKIGNQIDNNGSQSNEIAIKEQQLDDQLLTVSTASSSISTNNNENNALIMLDKETGTKNAEIDKLNAIATSNNNDNCNNNNNKDASLNLAGFSSSSSSTENSNNANNISICTKAIMKNNNNNAISNSTRYTRNKNRKFLSSHSLHDELPPSSSSSNCSNSIRTNTSTSAINQCTKLTSSASTCSINSQKSLNKITILGKEIITLPGYIEKEIKIKKNYDELGLVVDSNHEEGQNGCLVKEIKLNSALSKDNRIRVGDYILCVNNENMRKITNSTAKAILKRASLVSTDVVIKYIPSNDAISYKENCEIKSTLSTTSTNTSMSSITLPNNENNNANNTNNINTNHAMHTNSSTDYYEASKQIDNVNTMTSNGNFDEINCVNKQQQQPQQQSSNANDLIASSLWGPPHIVTIHREVGKSLGISIVGGKLDVFGNGSTSCVNTENFISGIFIKHVLENSPAGRLGVLKTGDRILQVNSIDLTQATHDNAVDVIRNAESPITFLIQSLLCANYPPEQVDQINNMRTDEIIKNNREFDETNKFGYTLDNLKDKYNYLDGELFVVQLRRNSPDESLGLSLSGNINLSKASVFICGIYSESIAKKNGLLKVGDQILEINGQVLYGRAHSNVTPLIRSIKDLDVFLVVLRNNENFSEMYKPSILSEQSFNLRFSSTTISNQTNSGLPQTTISSIEESKLDRRSSLAELISEYNKNSDHTNKKLIVKQHSLALSAFNLNSNNINKKLVDNENIENENSTKQISLSIITKKVTLKKGVNGFGIAISEDKNNKLIIRGINPNGVAYQDGNLKIGDEIIAINGIYVNTMKYDEVMHMLHATTEPVEFSVITNSEYIKDPSLSKNIYDIINETNKSKTMPRLTKSEQNSTANSNINIASSFNSLNATSTPPLPPQNNPKTNVIRVGEETLIEIEKGKIGLGVSIVGGSDTQMQAIIIHDIYENGAAHKDRRLAVGDQIIKVNNIDLKHVTHEEALNILRRQTSDFIQLLVYRGYDPLNIDKMHEEDRLDIFCVDLYKKFGKGLGFSIIGRRDGCGVFISHIIEGGCTHKDGRLMVGDLILEVNGRDMRKAPYDDVAFILKTLPPQSKVTLKIGRLKSNSKQNSRRNSLNNEFSSNSHGTNKSITNSAN